MTATVQTLLSTLQRHGLRRKDISRILPEWWNDELTSSASGAQQARIYLAKALSLRFRALSETPPRVEFELPDERRFKLSGRTTESDVTLAVALARSASKITLSAFDTPFRAPSEAAADIRAEILAAGNPWVGLSQLVDYCWDHGIPIIHLASPLLGRKMDGIAMSMSGRPSIVLSNKRRSGFLLFHLAHELGHIALGHVGRNGAIVDDEIKEEADGQARDPQEVAADRFAIELLTGNAHGKLALQSYVKADVLARRAIQYGRDKNIDPTHVVLNCAHNDKTAFPLFVSAANKIGGEESDQQFIAARLFRHISENLKPDSEFLLRNLIGQE